jgi:hypothetical protein
MKSILTASAVFAVCNSLPPLLATFGIDFTAWGPAVSWALSFAAMFRVHTWLRWLALPHFAAAMLLLPQKGTFIRKFLTYPALSSVLVFSAFFSGWPVALPESSAIAALGASFQVYHMAAGVARFMIYPAPLVSCLMDIDKARDDFFARYGTNWKRIHFPSSAHKGVKLDGIEFRNPAQKGKRWIIYLGGNGEVYEFGTDTAVPLASSLGANMLLFNHRGVGHSGGEIRRGDDLVHDAHDAIEYLLRTNEGLTEDQILLFGHSIGGGVASQVVATHHTRCSLILDRSFSSLVDAAISITNWNKKFVELGVGVVFGDLNSVENLKKIAHDRVLITFHQQDQIIRYTGCSIARLPEIQANAGKRPIVELTGRAGDPHNCSPHMLMNWGNALTELEAFYNKAEENSSKL